MENFVRIIMDKQDKLNESLFESVFTNVEMFETQQDCKVIEIPLARVLSEKESDDYAERLANMMFENGYEDFDIEITTGDEANINEETYDGDEFFEAYGDMWYSEDESLDEAEYRGRKVSLGNQCVVM